MWIFSMRLLIIAYHQLCHSIIIDNSLSSYLSYSLSSFLSSTFEVLVQCAYSVSGKSNEESIFGMFSLNFTPILNKQHCRWRYCFWTLKNSILSAIWRHRNTYILPEVCWFHKNLYLKNRSVFKTKSKLIK